MTRVQLLDADGCRRLAGAVGDALTWPIMTHALLTGLGRAYVIGDVDCFEAAMVVPDYCPDEPQAWGEPTAIWRIASHLPGLTAIEMPSEIAPRVAEIVERGTGRAVRLLDEVFFLRNPAWLPPPVVEHPAVRLLTRDDVDLLASAPRELSGGDVERARRMLTEGFYAAAVVEGRIVGRVEASCRTPRYANLGAIVLPEFRRQGIALAAASLVTRAVLDAGQTPVWSTAADNVASQGTAMKLGFREVARSTYVVLA